MNTFEFIRPKDPAMAVATAAQAKTAQQGADVRFLAGGTTLIDLMKLNVETPARLIDINRLPLDKIESTPDGGLKIGATVEIRISPTTRWCNEIMVLSQASRGASAQPATWRRLRATCSSERCVYFRDRHAVQQARARHRLPGHHRQQPHARHPGHQRTLHRDQSVGHVRGDGGLEATIHVQGSKGSRAVSIGEFHLLPGNTPQRETVLEPGDLITHVTLPPPVSGSKQVYLKLRDRASYEFALASAAVVITIDGGNVTRARIALGGVGTKPWRSPEAETALVGQPANQANFRKAAEAALRDATPQSENAFKIELATRCLTHALQTAATT